MLEVLVYSGEGVGPGTFKLTMKGLKDELDPSLYSVRSVDHKFFTSCDWEKNTSLLVIPGGRDLPYHHHLRGAANSRISRFVAEGGAYVGICAGAYYGSAVIEFEKEGPHEVLGERELAFYPGKAVGPAFGDKNFCYDQEATVAPIKWKDEECLTPLYFNGGCYFDSPHEYANVSVLATYADSSLAAIVLCHIGKGKALLSGIHPEYSSLNQINEEKRRLFWKKFLQFALS